MYDDILKRIDLALELVPVGERSGLLNDLKTAIDSKIEQIDENEKAK